MSLFRRKNLYLHLIIATFFMIMDSIREISKEKDIIRIIGRMPDCVMDKDPEVAGEDILANVYEVTIETQDNLKGMLQKAGYKVTSDESYTAVIIGDRVPKEKLNSIPDDCKKISVYSMAAWLADNTEARKIYRYKKNSPSMESQEIVEKKRGNNILLYIIAGILLIVGFVYLGAIFLVVIIFIPGALKVFLRSFIK